jgi:hypothetical protein
MEAIMAEDLTGATLSPTFHNFTGDTNTTEIKLPPWARFFSVHCKLKNLFVCNNGATDGGAPPTHKGEVPKGNYLQLRIGQGMEQTMSMFVACQDGTAEISIIIEE